MLDAASIRIVPRAVFAADQVRVRTADFMRVDFAAIKQQTEAADLLSTRTIADLMAQAVWKLIGDEERMRQLLDQDVSDIAQVRLEAFDIGKIKAACKMALQQGWDIGSKQARREIIKSSGHKYGRVLFEYDEDQHPRDENGRWTDGGGGDAPVAKVVVEYDKNVRSYRVLSLDADGNEVGDATYVGDKRTATMDAILRERDSMEFDPAKMTGSEITKAQTLLEKQASMINDALIEKGRGNEKPSETVAKKDLTSQAAKAVWDKQAALRNEVQTRAGPGHNRLPRGVGSSPRKNMSRAIFAAKPNTIRDRAAAYLDANSMRMAQNLGDGARAMIQQELTRGVRTGDTPAAIAAAILDRLESKGFTDRDGIEAAGVTQDILDELEALDDVPNVPAYINTLVRTNSFEALNEARFAEFTDPELEGWVEALEYSAVMDERTTEFCQYMDERVYRADNEVWNAYRPPNHFNCRSLLIPVTKTSGWDGVEDDPPEMQPADGFARCGCGTLHFEYDEDWHPRDANGRWMDTGAGAAAADAAPKGEYLPTGRQVPFKVDEDMRKDAEAVVEKGREADARVRIDALIATQSEVRNTRIQSMLKEWAPSDKPLVAEIDGKQYLVDGHHRVSAMKWSGAETVDVRLFKMSRTAFSYDEDQHPRDERGRWTNSGAAGPLGGDVWVKGASGGEVERPSSDAMEKLRAAGDDVLREHISFVEKNVTPEQRAALFEFSKESTFRDVQAAPQSETSRLISQAISTAPPIDRDIAMYRGVGLTDLPHLEVGASFSSDRFTSMSSSYIKATDFAMESLQNGGRLPILMQVRVPEGSRGLLGFGQGESEFIFDRGARFKLRGWEDRYVHGREVRTYDVDYLGPREGYARLHGRHFSYDEDQHPRDERDNMEPWNAPGGVKAWNLYEGQKLAPKETGKLKPVSERTTQTLHQEYDAVINVGGRVYGVSKYEDPDAGDDNEDESGNIRQYVYAYTPLDNPSMKMTETMTASVTQLIDHINGKQE